MALKLRTVAPAVLAVAVLATAMAVDLPPSDSPRRIEIPAVLESTQVPSPALPGSVGAAGVPVTVTPARLHFGATSPGSESSVVELRIANTGPQPLQLRFRSDPFEGPEGAQIPGGSILLRSSPNGAPLADGLPVVAPGGVLVLHASLLVPSGAETYVPAGAYRGSLTLLLEGDE